MNADHHRQIQKKKYTNVQLLEFWTDRLCLFLLDPWSLILDPWFLVLPLLAELASESDRRHATVFRCVIINKQLDTKSPVFRHLIHLLWVDERFCNLKKKNAHVACIVYLILLFCLLITSCLIFGSPSSQDLISFGNRILSGYNRFWPFCYISF